ncbi:MAG TPA: hypothetical protein VJ890_07305 [Vineibacter sp.]|nr:hypothetical protein [Vineibacter sp.]
MRSVDESPQFKTPAPWGVGSGPIVLRSIGEAKAAAGRRIEEIAERGNALEERDRLLALLQLLASAESAPSEADLQSAKLGIKGFVLYVHRRTADDADIRARLTTDSWDEPPRRIRH